MATARLNVRPQARVRNRQVPLEQLVKLYPEGTVILFQAEGQADIGVVEGHDIDSLSRPFLCISAHRTAYPREVIQRLDHAQVRECYELAMERKGYLPRWTIIEK